MTELADGPPPADTGVRLSRGRLADGREIVYFDDSEPYRSGRAERHRPDTRRLPPAGGGSILRLDALSGEWVAIASHRNERTLFPPADECPLCPTGRGRMPSEVPASDYDVVVFENRFPSLTTRAAPDEAPLAAHVDAEPLWPQRPGVGRCEVVCFTSDHTASFASLPAAGARGGRGVGTADRGAVRAARRAPGVLLREPRRGDRGHAAPPARADLRLPVRDAADRADARPGRDVPAADRRQPAGRPAGRRAPSRHAGGTRRGGVDGLRPGGGALAGRGAPRAAPRRPRPARAGRRRAGGARGDLSRAAAPGRPVLRRRGLPAVHRGLAPGADRRGT